MNCFTVEPRENSSAKLELYLLEQKCEWKEYEKRPFVLICPGGAYAMCGDRDSEPIALAFVGERYHAGVLRYSIRPSENDPPVGDAPFWDVLAAIKYVRQHADEWGVDPDRIIVEGDSAGGHASIIAAEHWNDTSFYPDAGPLCKPNALILGYPVITAWLYGHSGSIFNLTGDWHYSRAAEEKYSAELHVNRDVPPTFLWHSMGDDCVPCWNSYLLAKELHKLHIPYELHIFTTGWHGLSLGNGEVGCHEPHAAKWFSLAIDWLSVMGFGPKD